MASASTIDKENLGISTDGNFKKPGLNLRSTDPSMKKPIANKSIIKSAKPTRKALGDVKNVNRGQELLESLAKVHSQQISDDMSKPTSSKGPTAKSTKSDLYDDIENMPTGSTGTSFQDMSEQILPLKDRLSERSPEFFQSLMLPPKKVTREELVTVYPEIEAEIPSPFVDLPPLTDEDLEFIRNFDQLDLDECLL